ncbi:MAG: ADP-forming succinate--CoA ligase subunit beta [Hydrogenophilaceae bacterium]|jgi:succinyl-CoA synthetase beta subunit|nr:ADP-forming succinate--CoA ligase subunit beta [Hydrogenophilaceae bacterium]
MNIHEYQAKEILRAFGAPTPRGFPAFTPEEAVDAAAKLGGSVWVVKAQIHAGGRGKGRFKEAEAGDKGGVRIAKAPEDVGVYAEQMLGRTLVTLQTGEAGRVVRRLYIEEGANIARELYLSALVDREAGRVAFVASDAGGMNIEEVAHETPERITTVAIDPDAGVTGQDAAKVAGALKLEGDLARQCEALLKSLYEAFTKSDMSLLEINPLMVTGEGKLVCLDAKVSFDSNAEFRHPEWEKLRDLGEEDPKEIEASKYDLAYIALDGDIGCMVNGAGLAMATMDIIKLFGEEPANFLDVGGGADQAKVSAAFKIITADPKVKGILINIFGGIMKCDVLAAGVVAAVKEVGLKVPLVVRLEGTNVAEGKKIIAESGLNVINADDLEDAARKIVAAVRG